MNGVAVASAPTESPASACMMVNSQTYSRMLFPLESTSYLTAARI